MSAALDYPLIGIPCQHNDEANGQRRVTLVSQNLSYVQCIIDAGGVPILLAPTMTAEMLRQAYSTLHGVLLAGGVDVAPTLYGEEPHDKLGRLDCGRDRTEIQLTRWALADGLPLFGICRGIQVMNVAAGGTLYQDIASQCDTALPHRRVDAPRDYLAHTVRVAAGTRLATQLGPGEIGVNSLHHQALKDLAAPFRATAWAADGLIEGIEGPGPTFCLAVQWHPEELAPHTPAMAALFAALIAAARERATQLA